MRAYNKTLGFLALLADGLLLALFGLFSRKMSLYVSDPMQILLRMGLVVLFLTPYILVKYKSLKFSVYNPFSFIVLVLSFPLYILFFTVSVNNAKVANAFFYIFISSVLTSYLIGNILFKEKTGKKDVIVSFLLLSGLFFFIYPFNFEMGIIGFVAGLLSGVFWAISNATRKLYDGKVDRWLIIFLQMITGSIIGICLVFLSNQAIFYKWDSAANLIISSYAIGMILVQYLLFVGLKNFNLNLSSVVLASQLVFALFIGVVALREIPNNLELIGSILVSCAIFLSKID